MTTTTAANANNTNTTTSTNTTTTAADVAEELTAQQRIKKEGITQN